MFKDYIDIIRKNKAYLETVEKEEVSPQVKGMICDCGFISPKQEISYCLNHYFRIPAFPIVNILNLYCKVFAKFGLSDVSCVEELKKSKTPILIVHGDGDDFVPYSCSVENFKS